jgi:5-methylcytosine-specific restriction endonuclease McrA
MTPEQPSSIIPALDRKAPDQDSHSEALAISAPAPCQRSEWQKRKARIEADPRKKEAFIKRRKEAEKRYVEKLKADPERLAATMEKKKEFSRRKYKNNENYRRAHMRVPKRKLGAFKGGARNRGLEWLLSDDEAFEMFKGACHYCKRVGCDEGMVGIDRKDNSRGYSTDNCVPCCETCNRAKGVKSYEFMLDYVNSIARNLQAK